MIGISPGKYREDLTVTKPNVRIQGSDGTELQGTLRVEAPGAVLIKLMIQDADHCVVLGSEASGCRIYFCRLAATTQKGVALEVEGTDTSGMEIFENQFYNYGGRNPDTDRRGLKHNWKPLNRAATGILVRGAGSKGPPLQIHHNRISGYRIGLQLESPGGTGTLPAVVWKNRCLANTVGMHVRARGCTIEENEVRRSTSHGMIVEGSGCLVEANVVHDNLGSGLLVSGATARNNVIAGNDGGAIVAGGGARLVHNTLHSNGGVALAVSAWLSQ